MQIRPLAHTQPSATLGLSNALLTLLPALLLSSASARCAPIDACHGPREAGCRGHGFPPVVGECSWLLWLQQAAVSSISLMLRTRILSWCC
jgi:hypothetical protein